MRVSTYAVQAAILCDSTTARRAVENRKDREGTALAAIKPQTVRDLSQADRSLTPTRIFANSREPRLKPHKCERCIRPRVEKAADAYMLSQRCQV